MPLNQREQKEYNKLRRKRLDKYQRDDYNELKKEYGSNDKLGCAFAIIKIVGFLFFLVIASYAAIIAGFIYAVSLTIKFGNSFYKKHQKNLNTKVEELAITTVKNSEPGIIEKILPKTDSNRHSKNTLIILCLFFGMLGVHRFKVGKIGTGITMILLTIFIIPISFIWFLIDFIFICTNQFTDKEGNKITGVSYNATQNNTI